MVRTIHLDPDGDNLKHLNFRMFGSPMATLVNIVFHTKKKNNNNNNSQHCYLFIYFFLILNIVK